MERIDYDILADAIVQRMKDAHHTLWIDPETHATQHDFVKMLITEHEEKLARRKRIQDKIAGSLILSSILGLIALLGAGAMDYISAHIK